VQFRNLQTVLATLQVVLERVERRSKTEPLDETSKATLSQILRNCKPSIEELQDLFNRHYLPEQDQPVIKLKTVLNIIAGEPELATIQVQIERYISAITAHSSAFAPKSHEISCVITADIGSIIDQR